MLGQFKLTGVLALWLAIAIGEVGAYMWGYHTRGVSDARDRLAALEDQRALTAKVVAADTTNTRDSTARLDVQEQQHQVEVQYVTREVVRYVADPAAGKCTLPAEWVRLYNQSNGLPGGVPASSATGPQADAAAQRAAGAAVPGLGHGGAERGDRQ